jgi:hypothetical protein
MEMAKYIYSILRSQINILWSWGFNNPRSLPNDEGIIFKVQGFKHRGYVSVVYNVGKDLFDITLFNSQMVNVNKIEDVYFDQLIEVIDNAVEKTSDYENRIKQEYSLL